jgi:uncharacterized membrane protein
MKIGDKFAGLVVSLVGVVSSASAHTSGNRSYGMMNDGWMHGAGHMIGMWGMGLGPVTTLLVWILLILGIYHLYQRIRDEKEE